MDKVTPKSADAFQANRDRAAPLLTKLKADGIGHVINGKIVPSISGETFETKSPVDGAVLGHPATSVAWLANKIAPHGLALEPGHVVLAGSFIRPIEARNGDTIHADYGPYGTVSCYFA